MHKNLPIDREVIRKSFRRTLSEDEQKQLDDWLAASAEHRRFYELARKGGPTDPGEGIGGDVLARKREELLRKARAMRRIRLWKKGMRYAAVLILPLALAAALWLQIREKEMPAGLPGNQIVAGGGTVVLELYDGRTYLLDTTRTVETGIEGNMAQAGRKELVYAQKQAEELVYNKVNVPRGAEFQLQLADGSKVWLNSATELSYPVAFTDGERVVYLKGEAYFEVARDTARPFIVVAEDNKVQVYGTQFNVNTHHAGEIQTVLVKGKVGVTVTTTGEEIFLEPGQLAVYEAENRSIKVSDVDVYPYIAWKEGEFVFQNETIEEIMDRLCLWYDADVFYSNEQAKKQRFTGIIRRFSDISDVLYLIGETATVDFSIQNRTIIVK